MFRHNRTPWFTLRHLCSCLTLVTLITGSCVQLAPAQDGNRATTFDATAVAARLLLESFDRESALMIGELHGSTETPALVGRLVGALADRRPVTLGLEGPRAEQTRIERYLASDGSAAARSDLLAGDFWQPPPERSDGRRSLAMAELLETVRRLRAEGADIEVATIDNVGSYGPDGDRRNGMAAEIDALAGKLATGHVVLLMGNFHARITPFPGRIFSDGVEIESFLPTAGRVTTLPLTSVDVTACQGSFWACTGDSCGPQQLTSECPIPDGAALYPGEPVRDGYHFTLVLEELTASPPAR
jgi:hypothetical protein